jgi:hypothetical protein
MHDFGQTHSRERRVLVASRADDSLDQPFDGFPAPFRIDDNAGIEVSPMRAG